MKGDSQMGDAEKGEIPELYVQLRPCSSPFELSITACFSIPAN